ncbi:glycosyltransferase family 2 protein [Mucilaginibacter angelicae]|uniref:Glycosyltransferase family 2 protein n=1 Tax=Mucilaginibacter angelicae TaxID=869718 RepID=A0ABV6L5U9_9SPHI
MKLSAIIVTYFPEMDELVKNIISCINDVDKIIIWENTPSASLKEAKELAVFKEKLVFSGTGENVGIASALNYGVNWSIENDYTHILTLDQDSYFEDGVLTKYKDLVEQQTDKKIGIFGINPISGGHYLYEPAHEIKEVADTITSGSIIPLHIFRECGLFMDELFIDAVDYEFCYRINKLKGYKTVVFTDIVLKHKVGYVTKSKWGFKTDNYSAFRTYFIVRNHIIIWKRYPDIFPRSYKKVLIKTHIASRVVKVIIAESDKVKKIKAIIIGAIHGLKGKLGYYKIR